MLALLSVSIDQRVTDDLAAARENGERAVEGLRALYGDDHPHTAGAISDLAVTLRLLDRCDEARSLSAAHPTTLACGANLAMDLRGLGRDAEAGPLAEDIIDGFRRSLGVDHPATAGATAGVRDDCDIDPFPLWPALAHPV